MGINIFFYSDSSSKQKMAVCILHGPPAEAAAEIADCSDDAVTNTPTIMVTSANNV